MSHCYADCAGWTAASMINRQHLVKLSPVHPVMGVVCGGGGCYDACPVLASSSSSIFCKFIFILKNDRMLKILSIN